MAKYKVTYKSRPEVDDVEADDYSVTDAWITFTRRAGGQAKQGWDEVLRVSAGEVLKVSMLTQAEAAPAAGSGTNEHQEGG